jgi:2-dehydro-3-deoxyphosphogalactonate aldolase
MTDSVPWPKLRRSLVAILRGVTVPEVPGIVSALVEEGFEAVEIPLNSPDPFVSIERAVERFGGNCLIGAGTVLSPADCDRLAAIGGRLVVSPNTDPLVIAQATAHGMVSMPGIFSPTDAFVALRSGASALKVFPASVLGPAGIAAIRAVLPPATVIGAVGGVSEDGFADYARAGVTVFGLGSSLYRPGDNAATIRTRARRAVAAYDAVSGGARPASPGNKPSPGVLDER